MKKACRKRPCRICRRWFRPDPRLKDRQMTCGEEACKREWHRRKCAEWNKANAELLKRERLAQKLRAVATQAQAKVSDNTQANPSSLQKALRVEDLSRFTQEVMVAQVAIIIDYLRRQRVIRAQEVMMRQVAVNTG